MRLIGWRLCGGSCDEEGRKKVIVAFAKEIW